MMVNFDCSAMWCELCRTTTFFELKFLTWWLFTCYAVYTALLPLLDCLIWHWRNR